MKVFVVGLNHKIADVDVREKLAFQGDKLEEGLIRFRELPGIEEAMISSTCNRVELYAGIQDARRASESVKSFLSEFHNINRRSLDNSLYVYDDIHAVRHVFRVAASLDSMVLGEPQILGQLKDAFELALAKHPRSEKAQSRSVVRQALCAEHQRSGRAGEEDAGSAEQTQIADPRAVCQTPGLSISGSLFVSCFRPL